jgi:hypothetical protein
LRHDLKEIDSNRLSIRRLLPMLVFRRLCFRWLASANSAIRQCS